MDYWDLRGLKFTVVCKDKSGIQSKVVAHPPLGVIRLNMTCGTANIGITHVLSCINICWVLRMLFEHEADRTSSEGPSKC